MSVKSTKDNSKLMNSNDVSKDNYLSDDENKKLGKTNSLCISSNTSEKSKSIHSLDSEMKCYFNYEHECLMKAIDSFEKTKNTFKNNESLKTELCEVGENLNTDSLDNY